MVAARAAGVLLLLCFLSASPPSTAFTQGPAPEPRSYHTASLIGDKLLIFGGKARSVLLALAPSSTTTKLRAAGRRQWFSDVVMLDIPSRSWNPITLQTVGNDAPTGRAYHTATVVQDTLVCILGGYNGSNMCKVFCAMRRCSARAGTHTSRVLQHIALIDLASMSWLTYGKVRQTAPNVGCSLLNLLGTDGHAALQAHHQPVQQHHSGAGDCRPCDAATLTVLPRNALQVVGGHDGHSFLNSLVFAVLVRPSSPLSVAHKQARMDLDPLFEFVASNSPQIRVPTLQVAPLHSLVVRGVSMLELTGQVQGPALTAQLPTKVRV